MVEALRHEDFYVTGTWVNESLGVYVGWVARKNSFSDGMPLRNECETQFSYFQVRSSRNRELSSISGTVGTNWTDPGLHT